MNKTAGKILIVYASRYGSTAEIAQFISEKLSLQGYQTNLMPAYAVQSIEGYDGVVLGSAIYATHWLPAAIQFLERFRSDLAQVPVAYFTVCMALRGNEEKMRPVVGNWIKPQCELVPPVSQGFFPGVLEWRRMGWVWRLILWLRKSPQGDFRNWRAIEDWALTLPEKFRLPAAQPARSAK